MKVAYFYSQETKIYDHAELVKEGDPAPTSGTGANGEALGVTMTWPADGLYEPRKFDADGDVWTGDTKEHWLAAHPTPTPEPTAQEQANASILLQIAQNKAAQDKTNATMILQIAKMNGGTK